jgi:hypothetical protein
MSLLNPLLSGEQHYLTTPNIDRSVEDTLSTIPGNGYAYLLPDTTIAIIQRRRFANNGLVKHQDDGAFSPFQPVFKPPLACCQVAGHNAR